jgi:type IV pilus assembly protein PilB
MAGFKDLADGFADLVRRFEQLREDERTPDSELARQLSAATEDESVTPGSEQEEAHYRALAERAGLRFADADELLDLLEPHLAHALPREERAATGVLPVARVGQTLLAAVSAPDAAAGLQDLKRIYSVAALDLRMVTPTGFRRLQWALDLGLAAARRPRPPVPAGDDLIYHDVRAEPQAVALLDAMLLDAIGERATDIHLERYPGRVRVRLRIDGRLRDVHHYDLGPEQLAPLIRVAKVRSGADLTEPRLPQSGSFQPVVGGRRYYIRLQTQPTLYGENAILRVLPQDEPYLDIEQLGFPTPIQRRYRRDLSSPGGLLLLVGPTGAGKTTTLHAGLKVLAEDPSRKVLTLEDTFEYATDNIQQSLIRPDLGLGYADAMRTLVRQDPDVIFLGEIRDPASALEAIRASQTGHLVLTTLHCNDAVDAMQRLRDLGIHPNAIAAELLAIVAQRLARRVCTHCRQPAEPSPELTAEVFPDGLPDGFVCFRGQGCEACGHNGAHGRIAVGEYLPATRRLRKAIAAGMAGDDLRELALDLGLVPIRDRALELVRDGTIAFEELPLFLRAEQLSPEYYWRGRE